MQFALTRRCNIKGGIFFCNSPVGRIVVTENRLCGYYYAGRRCFFFIDDQTRQMNSVLNICKEGNKIQMP